VRLTVELDGRPVAVEVADDLSTARLGDATFPVRVVERGPNRVELEIGGETVVVEGWPDGLPAPPGPVDVNGERWAVRVSVEAAGPPRERARTPAPGTSALAGAVHSSSPEGVPVVPPMPGRVVEVRVAEGQAVAKGTVLLVLEAMKMRNEVTATVDGVVRDLKVREGANVRARETMLVIVPGSPPATGPA